MTIINVMESDLLCDWITIIEPNIGQFTEVNQSRVVEYKLNQNGKMEIINKYAKKLRTVGSHNSSAQILITEHQAMLSFNPSRWNKPDNVQHHMPIEKALLLCNDIMHYHDQPSFELGVTLTQPQTNNQIKFGSYISRLDITTNQVTGSKSNSQEFLRLIKQANIPRFKKRARENSITFGESPEGIVSSHKTIKAYLKGEEIRQHNPRIKTQIDFAQFLYRNQLAQHCEDLGLLRIELVMKLRMLEKYNLRSTSYLNQTILTEIYNQEITIIMKQLHDIENLRDHVSPKMYSSVLGTLLMYQKHYILKNIISKKTFYAHKKILLEFGIDISDTTVTELVPQKVKPTIIQIRPYTTKEHVKWQMQNPAPTI